MLKEKERNIIKEEKNVNREKLKRMRDRHTLIRVLHILEIKEILKWTRGERNEMIK